jgi:hypothetical protein
MREIRKKYRRYLREITGNAYAAVVFVIRDIGDRYAMTLAGHPKTGSDFVRADSESRILAIKKFLRPTPSRLIDARQTRIFARIDCGRFGATSRDECHASSNIVNDR